MEQKNSGGRPRKYRDAAERMRAYRSRKRAEAKKGPAGRMELFCHRCHRVLTTIRTPKETGRAFILADLLVTLGNKHQEGLTESECRLKDLGWRAVA
jgi:hypothetical protein